MCCRETQGANSTLSRTDVDLHKHLLHACMMNDDDLDDEGDDGDDGDDDLGVIQQIYSMLVLLLF